MLCNGNCGITTAFSHDSIRYARAMPQAPPPPISETNGGQAAPNRVYADWTVYKTKGAMTVRFIKPSWRVANSPGGGFVVDRLAGLLVRRE